MDYIQVTPENIDKEHICCAISGEKDPQVISKKQWLKDRMEEGLVFLKGDIRGKCFIEYIPAEKAWVPPLEGFWWQEGVDGIDYSNKSTFHWISVIRLPDFVQEKDFEWAVKTATIKKKLDCHKAEFLSIEEGLCVQIMHMGSFDNEPESIKKMDEYLQKNGYCNDISTNRLHHEIYLSDARRVDATKWKTVIRHPIKRE